MKHGAGTSRFAPKNTRDVPLFHKKRANNWIPAEWILRGGVVERCFKVSDSALGRDRLEF